MLIKSLKVATKATIEKLIKELVKVDTYIVDNFKSIN